MPPDHSPKKPSSWISRSIAMVFGKPKPPQKKSRLPANPVAPTKAETSLLEPFVGLPLNRIHVPQSRSECKSAAAKILKAGIAGFDTEAKPTFKVGEKSTGPHVVQFALNDRAYIFQLCHKECEHVVAELIHSEDVLKVGFGLRNDHGQIKNRFGITARAVLDLDHVFKKRGYRGQVGVRAAMGAILHRNFPKSKTITTSNWAAEHLTSKQLLYAANDAYAALKIKEALDLE